MNKLRANQWFWLAMLIFLSTGLGYWGFTVANPDNPPLYNLYRSLQLFTLERGAVKAPHLTLNVARLLAPTVLVLGGLMAFFEFFMTSVQRA